MGKRKSTKPQKYVQQSDEEDDDHLEFFTAENEIENSAVPAISESNVRTLWTKEYQENSQAISIKMEKSEKRDEIFDQSEENGLWPNHLKLSIVDKQIENKYVEPLHHRSCNANTAQSTNTFGIKQNFSHQSHLESLLSDRNFVPCPFPDDRLNDGTHNASALSMSGTESDRRSMYELDYDRRLLKPKRRRKYVTYPATFRLEVVEHAERNGKGSAAKKYNICVEKVSMWCKTKDNILHKVKKGGFPFTDGLTDSYEDNMDEIPDTPLQHKVLVDDHLKDSIKEDVEEKHHQITKELEILYNDESDVSEKYELENGRKQDIVFPCAFKLRVVKSAEEKSENSAAKEFLVCERRVHLWCKAKDFILERTQKQNSADWECDLYVVLKSLLDNGHNVTVRDIMWRADSAQYINPGPVKITVNMLWLTSWCQRFNVLFTSSSDSNPQPLTEDACLILEMSRSYPDNEEAQCAWKGRRVTKVSDIIDDSKKLDASPSASDREDSFSFTSSNKRRRRSYTLAFKLEVVKFAQSHTKHATSRKYGIARRVISRWIADKEILQNDLMHASNQVFSDTGLTVLIDEEVVKWGKDLKKEGKEITKDMVCNKARSLYAAMDQKDVNINNSWFKHWLLKWRKQGEVFSFDEEDDVEILTNENVSSSMGPRKQLASDRKDSMTKQQSSLNALKEACMTNAIHSTSKPPTIDLKTSNFPELLNAIHRSPSGIPADLSIIPIYNQAQGYNAEGLFKPCGSSLQTAINYSMEANKGNGRLFNITRSVSEDKKKNPHVKKRRERYSPDFKLTVIDYASSHSYQETSRKFGVHHITVSEWCKDKERIKRKVYCDNLQSKILKSETAEQKFLSWIQDCNKSKVVIKPTDVQNKANEILNMIGEAEVKKNCWWFYLWNKRGLETEKLFDDETDIDILEKESRVNYPPAVKIEIARVAERQSVNSAARCFRVARKRIREWVKTKEKLRWLAETGQVRERSMGKKVSCLDADKEVYDWFKTSKAQDVKPKSSEIRSKALEIFQKHGFSNMKCSKRWYKSWCKRYGIHVNSEMEEKLIKWVLVRYDENLPVSNKEILEFVASQTSKDGKEFSEKAISDYGINFSRRFPKLMRALPGVTETLPIDMENSILKFRDMLKELQEETNFSLSGIGCVDEIPLSFITCDNKKKVIVSCDVESCDVVVVLSCLADGGLLPPVIVLKEHLPPTSAAKYNPYVIYKEQSFVDEKTIHDWLLKIWLTFVPSPSLLILDCFKPHIESFVQEAMSESGVTPVIIPEGCSCKLQPINASGIVKKLQSLVQDTWNNLCPDVKCSSAEKDMSSVPSHEEIIHWILNAHSELKSHNHLIRGSFVVTGIAVAPDQSEDGLIGNLEWFSSGINEHVLSPASNFDENSDSET